MKRARRLVPVLAGLVGLTGACCVVAVGCSSNGGSSSGPAPEGGEDSTAESGSDVSVEAASEAAAEAAAEAATDGGPGVDTGSSADSGSATDADAGAADSSSDALSPPLAFPGQVAAALCSTIAACCGTTGDAATFNWSACLTAESTGFKGSSEGVAYYGGGNVTFNAAAAQACLTAIQTIDCATDQQTAAGEKALYENCLVAYEGTLPAGSGCQNTVECVPGTFCQPVEGGVGDAGETGLCTALSGAGGACGFPGSNDSTAQTACSYNGSGNTGLYCQVSNPSTPTQLLDASAWVCEPPQSAGGGCLLNVGCASFLCGGTSCVTVETFTSPSKCAQLTLDAGGD